MTAGKKSPLSGWRIAVKDIFQVEGIKTSVCNRAYYDLYPPAPKTAACIEILQQKGAHILGITKLAAFAATEEPIECVDYQAPWNPRADGYQSPAGSSSGSGVAVASYDWVDVAIGSDSKSQSSLSRQEKLIEAVCSQRKWSTSRPLERMLCTPSDSWDSSD